jgi:hypothetical protein
MNKTWTRIVIVVIALPPWRSGCFRQAARPGTADG